MEKLTISIVGLGLIGGSLGMDLSTWPRKRVIRGYDVKSEALLVAREKGAIDVALGFEEAIRGTDLVFLATPVSVIPEVFDRMKPFLSPHTLIRDVGSVKEWVCAEIQRDSVPWEYIGFHPMGGKEEGGIENAERGLFRGVPVLVSPTSMGEKTRELIFEIAEVLGGRVFF
ncbi:MAG: prephenate dehydrogenase/arogenate dehydrogenase family protein [Atribacterota bacterium]|nr:prephenate dehydrogenase/arogenate dehydrogenase family protein [Atribacterota bacterium]